MENENKYFEEVDLDKLYFDDLNDEDKRKAKILDKAYENKFKILEVLKSKREELGLPKSDVSKATGLSYHKIKQMETFDEEFKVIDMLIYMEFLGLKFEIS